MTEQEWIAIHNKASTFSDEFALLVRKYAPYYSGNEQLLHLMQEKTSVFSPFVWNERFNPPPAPAPAPATVQTLAVPLPPAPPQKPEKTLPPAAKGK